MRTFALQTPLIEDAEVSLLLDGLVHCFGYDFREYDPMWVKQRLWERVREEGLKTMSGLQERVIHEPRSLDLLLQALSPRPPCLFADPALYRSIREWAAPILRTYPSVSIWVPGCATGEDIYSLAILLEEAQILSRCTLYATDLSEVVWASARDGAFPLRMLPESDTNYRVAGGNARLSDYYTVQDEQAVMSPLLRERTVFSEHTLATDTGFHEFQMILCRVALNVYNPWLRERVLNVFLHNLSRFGVLGVDPLQSPMPNQTESRYYKPLVPGLYQKLATWNYHDKTR
ncbi:MAG: CheR family methyltransferase [Nitrospiraceae bacterium]